MRLTSTDEKTDELTAKYGGDIFGLQEEQVSAVNKEYIYPYFIKRFKEETRL